MRDDFVAALAAVLAEAADRPSDDADAYLAAGLIASTWSTAFIRAHAKMSETGDLDAAKGTFLALMDRGVRGTHAALSDTPYAAGS